MNECPPPPRECTIVTFIMMHIEIIFYNYLETHGCMFYFHVNFMLSICVLLHQETQRIYTYKNQPSVLGKWKIWHPLIFTDSCNMIYSLHQTRVLPWYHLLIEKNVNPYFTPVHFPMNCEQMPYATTATMSDPVADRVHPKIDVI